MGYLIESPLQDHRDFKPRRIISDMKKRFSRANFTFVRKNSSPQQQQVTTNPNSVDLTHFLFFILLGFFLVVFIPLIFADKNDF